MIVPIIDRYKGLATLDRMLGAVSDGLLSTDLTTPTQLAELLRHTSGFPALSHHRLFLEYRLDSQLLLDGYGHGYNSRVLRSLLRSRVDFAAGGPLQTALAKDPFAVDRVRYVDPGSDADPNWIEYDYSDGRFSDAPGVFFSFPARFRTPSGRHQVEALEARLGDLLPPRSGVGESCEASLADALTALVEGGTDEGSPIGLYRIGLCSGRQPGWMRVIVNGLTRVSLDLLEELSVGTTKDPVGWIVDHLAEVGYDEAPQIAASITLNQGGVEAIDLEWPYFHRVADSDERRARATAFCSLLAGREMASPSVTDMVAKASVLELVSSDATVEGLLLLNHFKFGIAGSTLGRIKVYFELLLRTTD